MKNVMKNEDGKYRINSNVYDNLVGTRAQVWHGTAYKTGYGKQGLTKKELMMNKHGRIVSVLKHNTAKKEKRLEKAGYFTQKGKFGYVKKSKRKKTQKKTQKNNIKKKIKVLKRLERKELKELKDLERVLN